MSNNKETINLNEVIRSSITSSIFEDKGECFIPHKDKNADEDVIPTLSPSYEASSPVVAIKDIAVDDGKIESYEAAVPIVRKKRRNSV